MRMHVSNPRQLGDVARIIREERGLTQRELATEFGTTQRWLSELESGKDVVAIERTLALLTKLGATISVEWQGQRQDSLQALMEQSVSSSSDLEGRALPVGFAASHEARTLAVALVER